ncbi:MAG: Gfo/Idh/MocA family oxidoreductase [Saprospiraceae bacterium]|nr:Gfo/Idh/MocA family oxidoreductase [Saprospiraceae bacterium]
MIKAGLIGYGHLGQIHFKCLQQTQFVLAGILDPKLSDNAVNEVPVFQQLDALLEEVDAVIIASTTQTHFNIAKECMEKGKHVFIEKPMTRTVAEAETLKNIADSMPQLITQVGFVERHNPAFQYLAKHIKDPKFIEVHRLASFNPRGSEVSVIYDLMIHDLDLLLLTVNAPVKEIKAHGVKIITDTIDICNARIEFENRAVANLTASRVSLKQMRKFRIFQSDGYLSMDLNKKESQKVEISEQEPSEMYFEYNGRKKYLHFASSGILQGNAILSELHQFYYSIINNKQGAARIANALKTSILAEQIESIAIASSNL